MSDVTRRMLDLLTLLQTTRRFTGAELVDRLGVSERTVRRDVERLRNYGYPVAASPGPGGTYGLTAGRSVPPLMFDDDEAVAIMLALAANSTADSGRPGSLGEAMTRAYGKVDQVLPKRLAISAATIRSSLEAETFVTPETGIGDITAIGSAIHDRYELEFDYRRGTEITHRRVEPHRQVHHLMRWYLVAWDLNREDWRTFRTDRIEELHIRTSTFERRPLPADTALDLVKSGVNRTSREAVIVVSAEAEEVADMLPFEAMSLEPISSQRTRVRLHCQNWRWLLLILSHLTTDYEVEAPQEWMPEITEFNRKVADGSAMR
ncbi:helix-turn-helix transcriptional regulator [Brevibacterium linens]|uniref:WYL domain containing protein n=1 Tax=Brevibacterium linens TaxID=1703 RepID=A0A0B8ZYD6_BRELN|nr:WYL domain-containing protein [Brevibacterium linens]KHS51301.1 WYL domain containing protein [Brevibacterium linens]